MKSFVLILLVCFSLNGLAQCDSDQTHDLYFELDNNGRIPADSEKEQGFISISTDLGQDIAFTRISSNFFATTNESYLEIELGPGEYEIYSEVGFENGCVSYDTTFAFVYYEFFFKDFFSPNEDGINDYFEIVGIKRFEKAIVSVFNLNGARVYQGNYSIDPPFDGKNNGKRLPIGIYVLIIDFKEEVPFSDQIIERNIAILH